MDYRTRFLNTLRGKPVDRLPFIETAKFDMVRAHSDWNEHLADDEDPRVLLGFDNALVPAGYEPVPIDWYAVPRFPDRAMPSDDGYVRGFDDRFGRVKVSLPASLDRPWAEYTRIFEDHVVSNRADWLEVRERFALSTDGRLPGDWERWCEHSRTASHPIVLELIDPIAWVWNLLGADGDTGLLMAAHDRPDLVRQMIEHFAELGRVCAERVCREARVDMATIGSDCLPIVGPNVIRDLAIDAYTRLILSVRRGGADLVCLCGRGDLRPLLDMFQIAGTNGIEYIAETSDADAFDEFIAQLGGEQFCIGCVDGRALLGTSDEIDREVSRKVALAKQLRLLPSLHVTRILPSVRWRAYHHYAESLRHAIFD